MILSCMALEHILFTGRTESTHMLLKGLLGHLIQYSLDSLTLSVIYLESPRPQEMLSAEA